MSLKPLGLVQGLSPCQAMDYGVGKRRRRLDRRNAGRCSGRLAGFGLEVARRELVFLQKPVELGAVAVGQTGGVGDVAVGDLQQVDEVTALELLLGIRVGPVSYTHLTLPTSELV